ncbi:hypothetical protein JTB14_010348 [Gonioctena quinquepunctata]|nr:hypothetical protein JTB14_010348 [Gonioctena quinquepunctata]
MTVHYIPRIVREEFSLAFTDKNAGMSPFNRSIFTDVDYAPSSVTDRPLQDNNKIQPSAIEVDRTIGTDGLPEPGPSHQLNDHSPLEAKERRTSQKQTAIVLMTKITIAWFV